VAQTNDGAFRPLPPQHDPPQQPQRIRWRATKGEGTALVLARDLLAADEDMADRSPTA
jgi:hypothetical protein